MNELVPVLRVSTNTTGSHSTIFPVGTNACNLFHDGTCDLVYVEMVSEGQREDVRRLGKMSFSSESDFLEWLCD